MKAPAPSIAQIFAHELAGPLGAARMALELLEEKLGKTLGKKEARELLKNARESLEGGLGILKNLRAYGKTTNMEMISLRETLLMAVLLTKDQTPRLQVEINASTALFLRGNFHALTQVWANLILNAAQVNPTGCSLKVSVRKQAHHLCISFANTGRALPNGIDIFSKGTTRKKNGTGLGLHLCRQILTQHRGTISAATGPDGRGAIFNIELPI